MPYEERLILFYYNELPHLFSDNFTSIKDYTSAKMNDSAITFVAHTSHMHGASHDTTKRFSKLADIPKDNTTTIFYGTKKGMLGSSDFCFCVPDSILIEVLINACLSLNIRLPRQGKKRIVVDNLKVGLGIILDDQALDFD
ncbi:MAG: hypothetical protein GW778_07035 [Alphaproteobacteria bacterium]|nr:hypothetical protein [Alphaproteobacteria bacterium]